MKTLYVLLTEHRKRQQHKHDLGPTHVQDEINAMTNYEFLQEISSAMETLLASARKESA